MRMNKALRGMLLLALLVVLPACGDDPAPARDVRPAVGYSAPDFELTDLSGKKVQLTDYLGEVVVLNFWATWCGPCKAELPEMQALYSSGEPLVTLLAVDQGEDAETVKAFQQQNGYTFNVLLDTDISVGKAYKASAIPATFVIDAEGVIRYKRQGAVLPGELDQVIKPLLEEIKKAEQ